MRDDVLPAPAAALLGGPPGRHVRASGWWRAVASWLVPLTAVPMVLAVLQREYCVRHGWGGSDQFWRMCFSDLPAQYALAPLDGGLTAYLRGEASLDQPILAGSVMSALGGLVPDGTPLEQSRYYVLYWVALITLLLAVCVWCTVQVLPADLQAAAQVALSPVIVLAAVVNSDALAVALVAGAMLAWHRQRYALTGILLGLGVLTRGYVLAVALALIFIGLREGSVLALRRVALFATTTVLILFTFFALAAPDQLVAAVTSWWAGPAGYGSLWMIPSITGNAVPTWVLSVLSALGWALALALGWVLTRDSYRTPTWPQVALVVVGMGMMLGKVVPVQAALWLLPLAAMAGVRWRDHLIWAACEALHFGAVWLYIGALTTPDRALPSAWYIVFLLVRTAGITWLVTRVWQATLLPPARPAPVPAGLPAPPELTRFPPRI